MSFAVAANYHPLRADKLNPLVVSVGGETEIVDMALLAVCRAHDDHRRVVVVDLIHEFRGNQASPDCKNLNRLVHEKNRAKSKS